MNMLELIGIPKTKTKKKKKIERIFRQKIVSSRRERKKTERTSQKERITEMTNNLPKGITGHSGNEDTQGRNDSDLNRFNFF